MPLRCWGLLAILASGSVLIDQIHPIPFRNSVLSKAAPFMHRAAAPEGAGLGGLCPAWSMAQHAVPCARLLVGAHLRELRGAGCCHVCLDGVVASEIHSIG